MKGDSAFSTMLRRSAPSQFCWVNTSWAPAIESRRDFERAFDSRRYRGSFQRLGGDGLNRCKRILDPMVEFIDQQFALLTRSNVGGNVPEIANHAVAALGQRNAIDPPLVIFSHLSVPSFLDVFGRHVRLTGFERMPEQAHDFVGIVLRATGYE